MTDTATVTGHIDIAKAVAGDGNDTMGHLHMRPNSLVNRRGKQVGTLEEMPGER